MAGSSEYRTLLRLTGDVQLAVKSQLVSLGGALVANELIDPGQYAGLRNANIADSTRAADLVGYIQEKVLQNAQHYHTFIDVLESQAQYGDILKKLKDMYSSLCGHPQEQHRSPPTAQAVGGRGRQGIDLLLQCNITFEGEAALIIMIIVNTSAS